MSVADPLEETARSGRSQADISGSSIGVVIVSYNSGHEVLDCLESLLRPGADGLRIVVVDNASTDTTVSQIVDWASGARPYVPSDDLPFDARGGPRKLNLAQPEPEGEFDPQADIALVRSPNNLGFAGGVNLGLKLLARDPGLDHFWILNPDCVVADGAVGILRDFLREAGDYGMVGGRVNYLETPDVIQFDGGIINYLTGVTGNHNLSKKHETSPAPAAGDLDFVSGASMVVSRDFLEHAGPMQEDYFLYYEEVDWALRRGNRPILYCPGFLVYHRAGSSIGSPTLSRRASTFSYYFKHRARMRFLWRFRRSSLPVGYAYSLAQIARSLVGGRFDEARAIFAAVHGLPPPASVRDKLAPEAAEIAFGARRGS